MSRRGGGSGPDDRSPPVRRAVGSADRYRRVRPGHSILTCAIHKIGQRPGRRFSREGRGSLTPAWRTFRRAWRKAQETVGSHRVRFGGVRVRASDRWLNCCHISDRVNGDVAAILLATILALIATEFDRNVALFSPREYWTMTSSHPRGLSMSIPKPIAYPLLVLTLLSLSVVFIEAIQPIVWYVIGAVLLIAIGVAWGRFRSG